MMKILNITTIDSTQNFFKSLISQLVDRGYTVDVACNTTGNAALDYYKGLGSKVHAISCSRNPINIGNIKCIAEIRAIVENGSYDIVHCHTPIAAACTRIACKRMRKNGLKVIYTAHGFHFYSGAPMKNWLLFFPIEKFLSKYTDTLITINTEDYIRAKKWFKTKKIIYIPGVGIDLNNLNNNHIDRRAKRKELGIKENEKLIISVGELNKDKNHIIVMKALKKMNNNVLKYVICGDGVEKNNLSMYIARNNLKDSVKLLGYRNDVLDLLVASDVFVFPSIFEGLPVSIMEAVSMKVPVICSNCRGNNDLIENEQYKFNCNNVEELIDVLQYFLSNDNKQVVEENYNRLPKFSRTTVNKRMIDLYEEEMEM